MKSQLHHILILVFLASMALATPSFAQDAGMQDYELSESDQEKMLYSPGGEGEVHYKNESGGGGADKSSSSISATSTSNPSGLNSSTSTMPATAKDSVSSSRVAPVLTAPRTKPDPSLKSPEKQAPPSGQDDSILSFNFLYYIIQKYKLQDIVD